MKKVIEYKTLSILEYFEEADTDLIIKRYQHMALWKWVSTDAAGDVILKEE